MSEVDIESSCLRLEDSKEGKSVRPVGLPVIECLQQQKVSDARTHVFPGAGRDNAFGALPDHWTKILGGCGLDDITPHVLRHSFASIANNLGFTETTVAALLGHAKVTGRYIHTMDAALIAAADTVAGYIQGLLDRAHYKLRLTLSIMFPVSRPLRAFWLAPSEQIAASTRAANLSPLEGASSRP